MRTNCTTNRELKKIKIDEALLFDPIQRATNNESFFSAMGVTIDWMEIEFREKDTKVEIEQQPLLVQQLVVVSHEIGRPVNNQKCVQLDERRRFGYRENAG